MPGTPFLLLTVGDFTADGQAVPVQSLEAAAFFARVIQFKEFEDHVLRDEEE